jgi:hypothetical protein
MMMTYFFYYFQPGEACYSLTYFLLFFFLIAINLKFKEFNNRQKSLTNF